MKKFTIDEHKIKGAVKRQMRDFILRCETLTHTQRGDLLGELGSNFFDDRFSAKEFMEDAVSMVMWDWKNVNLDLMDLWKKIAVANASISNEPHKTADEVVKAFQAQCSTENLFS